LDCRSLPGWRARQGRGNRAAMAVRRAGSAIVLEVVGAGLEGIGAQGAGAVAVGVADVVAVGVEGIALDGAGAAAVALDVVGIGAERVPAHRLGAVAGAVVDVVLAGAEGVRAGGADPTAAVVHVVLPGDERVLAHGALAGAGGARKEQNQDEEGQGDGHVRSIARRAPGPRGAVRAGEPPALPGARDSRRELTGQVGEPYGGRSFTTPQEESCELAP
jgi:hypothetical protein